MPGTIDEVPDDLRELFAWALREGTTNVLRHSAATRVRVTMTARHAHGRRRRLRPGGRRRRPGQRAARPDRARPRAPRARVDGVRQPARRLPAARHHEGRPMIRLLLADDQALVRGALAALLDLESDLTRGRPGGSGRRGGRRRPGAPRPTSRCSTSRCRASTGSPPRPRCRPRLPGVPVAHRHHVRAARLRPARARRRRQRVRRQGHPGRPARRRGAPRAPGAARDRPGPGGRVAGRRARAR